MLSFIPEHRKPWNRIQTFKYISCYLLSECQCECGTKFINLNTSHVIFYLYARISAIFTRLYLNTSHVIFYPHDNYIHTKHTGFKYISCYLLSIGAELKQGGCNYLNTSHVIFYLFSKEIEEMWNFNLNTSHVIFYLTPPPSVPVQSRYLNTSHVIFYQTFWTRFLVFWKDLNTSHVIFYR